MADLFWGYTYTESLTSDQEKTILQVKAPANQAVKLLSVAGSSSSHIKVTIAKQDIDATGDAATPVVTSGHSETVQSTLTENVSNHGSITNTEAWSIETEAVIEDAPFGTETRIGGGERFGVIVHNQGGSTDNVTVSIKCEE